MKIAQSVAALFALIMAAAIAYAFAVGDFSGEGAKMLAMPWGIVSLLDVYVGFLLFCGWVFYREKSGVAALVWTVAILILGNMLTAIYVVLAVRACGGDWKRFWLGARA